MKYFFAAITIMLAFAACRNNDSSTTKGSTTNNKDSITLAQKRADSLKALEAFKKPAFQYHFEKKSVWKTKDSFEGSEHIELLAALNRVDAAHLKGLDSFIAPNQYTDSLADYLPFPKVLPFLSEVDKIIIFSYLTQTFAAYDHGKMVLTGPTNMGKKASKTPTGLFFCNWKAKETHSTVDDSWILKWNFNVSNMGGVGFHQYALPGYPASHSCMRLWASQAKFLYDWADQWKLKGDALIAKGTPVIIYGEYPFGQPRPWFALIENSKGLDISAEDLQKEIEPHLQEILDTQNKRAEVLAGETSATDTTQKVDTTQKSAGA